MKTKLFRRALALSLAALLLLSLLLAGCAESPAAKPAEPAAAAEKAAEAAAPAEEAETAAEADGMPDFSTGSPWIVSSIQGVIDADTETDLKDDFYLSVNKDMLLSSEIRPGFSSAGLVYDLLADNYSEILGLFTDGAGEEEHDAQLAKSLYGLMLDWDGRNAQGVQPLKEITDEIASIATAEELTRYFLEVPDEKQGLAPFELGGTTDPENSGEYILAFASPALLLGDSAEYAELSEYGATLKREQDALILYLLGRLGFSESEAEKTLANCYEYESLIAPGIFTREQMYSSDYVNLSNNRMSAEEFEAAASVCPLMQFAENLGYGGKPDVILIEPQWLELMQENYDDAHLGLIKDYMTVHSALIMAEYLDEDCFRHYIDFKNAVTGTDGSLSDEEYAADSVTALLGWSVARMYCDSYFTEQDKQNIKDIIADVISVYSVMLGEEDFISDATKQKALEKLSALRVRALYPDDWTPYSCSGLSFSSAADGGTLWEALENMSRFNLERSAEKFSKPVDNSLWDEYCLPTTVNAFYYPSDNSINILAAICRGEIYSPDMQREEMLGRIGSIIGHEISHSFDGSGSRFDKDGNLSDWWTAEDRAAFDAKVQAAAEFAGSVSCWEGRYLNGNLLAGEFCADMGGMACMLQIARSDPDFDYDLFFRSYASLWSETTTYGRISAQLQSDSHPMSYFRVNAVLQQFDEFLDFYGITEGDGMYLAPEDRVAIW